MRAALVFLAFVSSAFAYSVLTPNTNQGWTNQGGQTLTWQRVDTDTLNFTALLTNQNITGFQPQVLAALVDGTTGTAVMLPPSGGWLTGSHFRVNLVEGTNNIDTIYAQSEDFTITASSSTLTSTMTNTLPTNTFVTSSVSSPYSSPSGSTLPATGKSGALGTYSANSGVMALLSLFAYALA